MAQFGGAGRQFRLDVRQGLPPVEAGLSAAQEIQVRAIEQQDFGHGQRSRA